MQNLNEILSSRVIALAQERIAGSLIGDKETVKEKINTFISQYGEINEIMTVSYIFDTSLQHRSYQYFKEVMDDINK